MLVVMKNDATEEQVCAVIKEIESMGYRGIPMPGAQRTAVCIIGNEGAVDDSRLLTLDGVRETIPVTKPYKLVSRETQPEPTVITVGDIKIGDGDVMAIYRCDAILVDVEEIDAIDDDIVRFLRDKGPEVTMDQIDVGHLHVF